MNFEETRARLINKVHKTLPEHIKRLSWSRDQLLLFQTERLKDILETAKNKSTYYKDILRGFDLNNFTLKDLSKLPILKKQQVMDNWDDIVAVEGITKSIAEKHLEKLRDGKIGNPYFENKYLFIATGGSSGKRGLFVWDQDFLAETVCLCFRYLAEQEIKSGNTGNVRLAVIEAPSLLHGSKHLFTVNYAPNIEVKVLSSIDTAEQQISVLNEYKPDYLIGFASVIAEHAHAQLKGPLKISPRWVSTNSEPLDDDMRQFIKDAWGIETCNSWGSVEIGLVAMETQNHPGMIIGEDGVILELVDNKLDPIKDMKDTRKVIATSLINKSFPLIRYVIDDVLEIEDVDTAYSAFREIKSILGRADDWFTYDKCRLHPIAFRHVLGQNKEIEEYQIVQTENGADIFIVSSENINSESIINNISKNLINEGLKEPKLSLKNVTSLPRHPETGKVKRFVALKK